jgi:hypothetical protein
MEAKYHKFADSLEHCNGVINNDLLI